MMNFFLEANTEICIMTKYREKLIYVYTFNIHVIFFPMF